MAEDVKFSIIAQNKTQKAFAAVKSSVSGLNKSMIGLGAAVAGAMGVGALGSMAKSALDTGDKIHKLTIRLGASAEALSQYRHVATLSGISFETLTMGWQRMTRRISESAAGTGMARKSFQELGVDVAALARMRPEQQFEVLADAIAKVEDPADRVRLAMKIFGSEGVSLLQTMEGGAAGLQQMRQEADALGMTMSQDMVNSIAATNDSISKVNVQVTSLVETIMGDLAPIIMDVTEEIKEWMIANRGIITQDMKSVIENLVVTFKALMPVVSVIVEGFNAVGKAIGWAAFQVYQFMEANQGLAKAATNILTMGNADLFYGNGAASQPQLTGAAALAASGGGGLTGQDLEDWNWQGDYGNATVVNNFNTQVSRSDAVAIANETARNASRQ